MAKRPLRVLHAPELVGGNSIGLARAERALGVDSRVVSLRASKFGFVGDDVVGGSALGAEFKRFSLLRRAIEWADIVHFNFGRSLFPSRKHSAESGIRGRAGRRVYNAYANLLEGKDLAILRSRGKRIVVTFQGSDARMPSRIANDHPAARAFHGDHSADDLIREEFIRTWDRYAQTIYALNPDLLRYLPHRARFQPYASVDPKLIRVSDWKGGATLKVAHAPTNQSKKGTAYLLDAVAHLRAEGINIELDLIEGVSHEQAMRRYSEAHVGVDQLLLGWYGALAVELMALGKPVCCYIDGADLDRLPVAMRTSLPLLEASWDNISDVLRNIAQLPREQLQGIGLASREYVEAWHDPSQIALQSVANYESIL